MMTITIRDLAKKLNLSITTVSRALDGYSDVAETTRQRVIEAAHEIGYEPTSAARQLRRKRADAIGYILPTNSPRFSEPFYTDFLAGLSDSASEHRIDLIISSCPPDSDYEKTIYRRWFQSRRVDGIVLNRIRTRDWRIDYLKENMIPFVCLGRNSANTNFPHIFINEQAGFSLLVSHLVTKGHQRIAFIGVRQNLVIQAERLAGYLQGLEAANIPQDNKLIIDSELTEDGGYQAAQHLLSLPSPPSAILGCNDLIAMGALRAVQETGYKAGKDIAIAGYDGIKETEYTSPPLTTIYQPTYEIASKLALMLITLISGKQLDDPVISLEPQLMLRESTG